MDVDGRCENASQSNASPRDGRRPIRSRFRPARNNRLFNASSWDRLQSRIWMSCAQMKAHSMVDLLFVIVPHSLLLDIAGPAEAFRLANLHLGARGMPPRFNLRFSADTPALSTSVGLCVADLEPLPEMLRAPTWIVLVGQPSAFARKSSPEIEATAQWLRRTMRAPLDARDSPHRLVAICSGALLAARAGLIGERQCTTHHELLGVLRTLAPKAQVVDNRVFLVDGPVASSAGVTAGIDLALHLIAEACGEAVAAAVAEDMVVYLRRSELDPGLSPFLAHRRHMHAAVHRVQDAVSAAPEREWTLASMAALAHVTERHLLRLFLRHAGVSPLHYLQAMRLERARQSLEHGASVTIAAEVAGFRSGLHLRRAWHRKWGGSPRDALRPAAIRPAFEAAAHAE
ncbi:GlxA family transcriptional regulator [Dokdonella sp.]|uniref:GlxA family transcriptional regulator n=1 Tax=Dokdonella sp. TaxID=2291710 RepID=UPI0037852B6D